MLAKCLQCELFRTETLRLLLGSALATLPAITFLAVIHRAVLAGLFAIRFLSRKSYGANRRRQN